MKITDQIIRIALENGATVAGIANMQALRTCPSRLTYAQLSRHAATGTFGDEDALLKGPLFRWPEAARSLLVVGLVHPRKRPELDWWDSRSTPGNRRLIEILNAARQQIDRRLDVQTSGLHYQVEKGGVFLKDAAVLAGLGTIGMNNMVVTPQYGPRLRFRALLLYADIDPTDAPPFFPCAHCSMPCRSVCPEKAMVERVPIFESTGASAHLPARDGAFDRELCHIRMEKDEVRSAANGPVASVPVKYCRLCEFACPVGKQGMSPGCR